MSFENQTEAECDAGISRMMDICAWTQDDPDYSKWDTGCGKSQYFSDGGVDVNGYLYCPYCGKKIVALVPEYERFDERADIEAGGSV